MHPYIVETIVKEKQREMLEEAARLRLLASAQMHEASFVDRMWLSLGNVLVRFGHRLQHRYGGAVYLTKKVCEE